MTKASEFQATSGEWFTRPINTFKEVNDGIHIQTGVDPDRWEIIANTGRPNQDSLEIWLTIAEIKRHADDITDEELEANARLCAASPDLYNTLNELLMYILTDNMIPPVVSNRLQPKVKACYEALAKARGDTGTVKE